MEVSDSHKGRILLCWSGLEQIYLANIFLRMGKVVDFGAYTNVTFCQERT